MTAVTAGLRLEGSSSSSLRLRSPPLELVWRHVRSAGQRHRARAAAAGPGLPRAPVRHCRRRMATLRVGLSRPRSLNAISGKMMIQDNFAVFISGMVDFRCLSGFATRNPGMLGKNGYVPGPAGGEGDGSQEAAGRSGGVRGARVRRAGAVGGARGASPGRGAGAGRFAVRVLRAGVDGGLAGPGVVAGPAAGAGRVPGPGHGSIAAEFFDVGESRSVAWARRPQAAALCARVTIRHARKRAAVGFYCVRGGT
jgi:hypothetical protein